MTDAKRLISSLESHGDIADSISLSQALYDVIDDGVSDNAENADAVFDAAEMLAYLGGERTSDADESASRVRASIMERISAERSTNTDREKTISDRDEKILRPKRGIRWKLLIPIAAAVILLASLAAMTFAGSGRLADITNAFWKLLSPGEKLVETDYELEKDVAHRDYDEFEAMLEAEGITGVLVPTGMTVSDPLVVEYGDYREITATFTDADGRSYDYEAQYPSQVQSLNAELTKIGGFDVLLSHYDDVYQAEFISNGVFYIIGTDDAEALNAFIASLGE